MRLLCALILLCLVAAGPVAALAISPGSVAAPAKITQAVIPAVTAIPKATALPVSTAPISPMLYISSSPTGAAVAVNGNARGITPLTIGLYPGTYTVVVTLAGYRDYTTTVTLQDGSSVAINAPLQPALHSALQPGAVSMNTVKLTNTLVPLTVTTPVPDSTCKSGEHCLGPADAALYYQPGWGHTEGSICGYAVIAGYNLTRKYCTFGTPSPVSSLNCLSGEYCLTLDDAGATLPPGWHEELEGKGGVLCGWGGTEYEPLPKYCIQGAATMAALQPGTIQSMAVINPVTLVPVSQITVTSATTAPATPQKPLGGKRQIGIAESFLSLFGGLFSHPACPANQTSCSGTCADLTGDRENCGSCGYTCFDPAVCSGGQCVAPTIPQPDVSDLT